MADEEEVKGIDRQGESSKPPAPVNGGGTEAGGVKGGGFGTWLSGHKVIVGLVIGFMVALLLGGMFAVGYVVGRPEGGGTRKLPDRRIQNLRPEQPGPRSDLPPERGGTEGVFPGILGEYREQITSEIAERLGISLEDLRDEMRDGKSISEIAEEKGVPEEELTAAVAAEMGEIADQLASEGVIEPERAERIKSNAEDLATRFIQRGKSGVGMPFD